VLDHLDADSAIDTAERIERCIAAQPLDLGSARVPLRTAIGVASILKGDQAGEVFDRALANAERAKAV
jgi:GGDEF domain-containing protein